MPWFQITAVISLCICMGACIFHFVRLVRLGAPHDYSSPNGSVSAGIVYSFTGAMSPVKKESAFLHLPTYAAGLIYHFGTFASILLFFLFFFNIGFSGFVSSFLSGFIIISSLCGIGVLVKRISKKELRALSNPDDYISNMLVTLFQIITALLILDPLFAPAYYIIASLLLLYLPVGKLKHTVYFFAARYHLGFYFGRRGVWPPK